MKYGEVEYEWQVWEGDEFFASGYAPTIEEAQRMAGPYVTSAMLTGESVVSVKLYERREILEAA